MDQTKDIGVVVVNAPNHHRMHIQQLPGKKRYVRDARN